MTTPTPETDAYILDSGTPNAMAVHIDFARKLERERDEALSALSTALREREAARQAIAMADGTLLQIVAERDAWKAKANASQQMVDALLKRGHVIRPSWGYHDGVFSIHISFKPGECGDDDVVSRNNLLKRLLEEESK